MTERRFTPLYDDIMSTGKSWGMSAFFRRALVCGLIRMVELQRVAPEFKITIAAVERWTRVDRKICREHLKTLVQILPIIGPDRPNDSGRLSQEDHSKLSQALGQIFPTNEVNPPNKRNKETRAREKSGRFAPSKAKAQETKPSTLVQPSFQEEEPKDQGESPRPESPSAKDEEGRVCGPGTSEPGKGASEDRPGPGPGAVAIDADKILEMFGPRIKTKEEIEK
jgi:hypothetical protein